MKQHIRLFLLKTVVFFLLVMLIEYYRRFRFVFDDFSEKLQAILTPEFIRVFCIALAGYAVFFFFLRRKRR